MQANRIGRDGMNVTNNTNFKEVERKMRAKIGLYVNTAALKAEGVAKSEAPWTDRTGDARNSIQGEAGWRKNDMVITLSGNMNYSVYLELAHEKKYAILKPTIHELAPEILKGYEKVVNG